MIHRILNRAFFGKVDKKRRHNRRQTFFLESLEHRLLLSASPGTATLDNGELLICGDDAANRIIVADAGEDFFVAGDFLDSPQFFSAAEVTSITVSGGAGDDIIVANTMTVPITLEGEDGADILFGGTAADTLSGGDGDDTIYGMGGDDKITGDAGNDLLLAGEGDDTVSGGVGDDSLVGRDGNDTLEGDEGNDILMAGAGDDTLTGGPGDDRLVGRDGADELDAGADDDLLFGSNDADIIEAGDGNDLVIGGSGDDKLGGGAGNDVLVGGAGDDVLTGAGGVDTLFGVDGMDHIDGGDDGDLAFGGEGADTIAGMSGDDVLVGGSGVDVIAGGDGADILLGGVDSDVLIGGMGPDSLRGQDGEDVLVGGDSNLVPDAAVLSEVGMTWGASGDYEDRMASVQRTLSFDNAVDTDVDRLEGDEGQDWFFSSGDEDDIADQESGELVVGRDLIAINDYYDIESGEVFQATVDNSLTQNDLDPGNGSLTVSTTPISGPMHGTLSINADGTFTYSHTGSPGDIDNFIYEVTNADGLTAQATVRITVAVQNLAPTPVNDNYTIDEDNDLQISAAVDGVLKNDTDPDGDALTVSTDAIRLPQHGRLVLSPDGSFDYEPDANFNGTDTFIYEVTDSSGATGQATVSIVVTSVNDAPVAGDASFQTTTGEPFSTVQGVDDLFQFSTDVENDTLIALLVTQATHGNAELNTNGTFTYTPGAGFAGTDSFTYRVSDGTDQSVEAATVTIEVIAANTFELAENTAEGSLVGKVEPPAALGEPVIFEFAPSGGTPEALNLLIDDHLSGDLAAPLVLIEYFDLECFGCANNHAIVKQLLEEYAGDLLVVSRHLPLTSIHSSAVPAALAAEAAGQQGAFDAMVDLIFERQLDWFSDTDPAGTFEQYAVELQLDIDQYRAAVAAPETTDRITRDAEIAINDLGLSSTPSMFLNGQSLSLGDVPTLQDFSNKIEDVLDDLSMPFSLDRYSGDIRVLDSSLLNYETNSMIALDVLVSDGTTSETVTLTATLRDVIDEGGIPPLPDGAVLTTTASGLQVYDLKPGDGVSPVRTDTVTVDYVGYLPDGRIFDSNSRIDFPLTGVIEGFAEGIEGMQVGGRRRIVIPPDLGYGPNGNPGAGIGGTDTITFDVLLRAIA